MSICFRGHSRHWWQAFCSPAYGPLLIRWQLAAPRMNNERGREGGRESGRRRGGREQWVGASGETVPDQDGSCSVLTAWSWKWCHITSAEFHLPFIKSVPHSWSNCQFVVKAGVELSSTSRKKDYQRLWASLHLWTTEAVQGVWALSALGTCARFVIRGCGGASARKVREVGSFHWSTPSGDSSRGHKWLRRAGLDPGEVLKGVIRGHDLAPAPTDAPLTGLQQRLGKMA